ncbi:hypothetical protein MNBD_GAMMA20-2424, partial [hydrothermal vent metagenome]
VCYDESGHVLPGGVPCMVRCPKTCMITNLRFNQQNCVGVIHAVDPTTVELVLDVPEMY